MKKSNKKLQKSFEWHMQLHFIIATALFFIASISTTAFLMLSQLPENTNFSAYYFYALTTILLPLVVVFISYLLVPKKLEMIQKLFWITVLSFAAMLVFITIQQITIWIPYVNTFMYYNEDSWMLGEAVRTSISFIPVVVYFAYVYFLRKKIVSH